MGTKLELNEDFPPEDPGNQLRAKMNGADVQQPQFFNEVLYTAKERGILTDHIDADQAMRIVTLFFIAREIASHPDPEKEIARVRM